MRFPRILVALPVTLLSLSALGGVALADVAPESKCKCSVPGGESKGALSALALAAGGAAVLLARGRARRRG